MNNNQTMDYSLARELKDAGFPRMECDLPGHDHTDHHSYFDATCRFRSPTLEELIEACGRGFRSLTFHSNGNWDAYMYSSFQNGRPANYYGSTPKEAVARLWLSLQK